MKPHDYVLACNCSSCNLLKRGLYYNSVKTYLVSLEEATLFATEEEAKGIAVLHKNYLVMIVHSAKLGKNRIQNETI